MYTLAFVLIFLLGSIIGSFLNVVIYRFNTGKSMVTGRSMCMTCARTLRWYELIPIVSYLIQSGKCRRCASHISHQYPLVEFGTGLIFALVAFHFMPVLYFSPKIFLFLVTLYVFIFSLLMVISVYDIKHKIIPDKLVYAYAIVSFFSIFITTSGAGPLLVHPSFANIIAGPLFALPFALIFLVSKGKWMGLGDAKLILGIGWMLGFSQGLAAITLSFWIGCIVSLALMFFTKKKMGMKTEIPFAPFLIISTVIVFFWSITIFSLSTLFSIS